MANPKIFSPRRCVALSSRLILLLIVCVVLLYGVIYPNLHVVLLSLQRDGNWSLQNYRETLAQRIVLKAIFSSVAISILTVAFCAGIGIPLAFFYVLTGAGLSRIDAALAEAGRSLGAHRARVLTRIVLPQLTPALVAAALLTFMTSMASFSAPLLFGGGVRVLTLEIYTARQRGDMGLAITETVILAAISLSALFFFQRYEGTRRFAAAAMKGSTRKRQAVASGKARA